MKETRGYGVTTGLRRYQNQRWCFVVCRACDHGRACCEDAACRLGAKREANDRHQCSDEGRSDHRDHMAWAASVALLPRAESSEVLAGHLEVVKLP